jgi:hypothetical protein
VERGAAAEDVRPDEHAGRRAGGRVHECASQVPSGVVTVTSASATATALTTRGSIIATPAPRNAELPPRHQALGLVVALVVVKMILIAHRSSSCEA